MALQPDRELGEARAALDRDDSREALRRLDRARRGYVNARDAEGLEHVLDMAALLDDSDERVLIGRDNLAYAVMQNLRHESRRAARERREPWRDPYPDLQAPAEHTRVHLTRAVKLAIGVGVLAGTALLAVAIVEPWVVDSPTPRVTVRLLNDTQHELRVRGCDDADCGTTWMRRDLAAGLETDAEVDSDVLISLFRIETPGVEMCLPVRVHDGYQALNGEGGALAVRLSLATPCPGTTVLPQPAPETF